MIPETIDNTEEQLPLFENPPAWVDTWRGMPEFRQRDLEPKQSVLVHFMNDQDRKAFAELIKQTITPLTRSLWYPPQEIGHYADRFYKAPSGYSPHYPIYIISKGRWDFTRFHVTAKALDKIGIPYRLVVEPQEYANYSAVVDPRKILVLPFSNLGQGSIPARNWVWENSIKHGDARHWILDDNIEGFYRLHHNLKTPVMDGAIFCAAEEFSDRYENVAQCGFNYFMFAPRKSVLPPFTLNTRIYSCILMQNNIPFRWRGRYNEDTDLSIRILKLGMCTVLFNAFLAGKAVTLSMKGGNTDELYRDDGRLKMAQSLKEQHPDVVRITRKWNRWQHHVNYSIFKTNKLILRPGVAIPEGVENYGMELKVKE